MVEERFFAHERFFDGFFDFVFAGGELIILRDGSQVVFWCFGNVVSWLAVLPGIARCSCDLES